MAAKRRVLILPLSVLVLAAAAPTVVAAPSETGSSKEPGLREAIRELASDDEDAEMGGEIVVEGVRWSGVPVVPLDETRSHDVLGPDRIRDITVTTYEEVVKRLPGVSSRIYSGDEYVRPSISTRGLFDNGFTEYTAVLVDGINMSTLFYGWTAISIFPFTPERIYSAEVIRGGYSVRYGPNTVGGVVNVITRPVPTETVFRQKVTYGSHNYLSSLTEFGGSIPDTGIRLLGTFVAKGGDTFRQDNRFDINEFALKGIWDIGDMTALSFSAFHWRAVHNLPGRLTKDQLDDDPSINPNPTFADWQGFAYGVSFTLRHDFDTTNWMQAYGYYRFARRSLDSARPSGGPYTHERSANSDMVNEGIGIEGEVGFEFGTDHVVHYGARLHRETIHRETFMTPLAGGPIDHTQDADSENVAISLNVDDTLVWGDLTVVLGVRFEHLPTSRAHDDVSDIDREFDLTKWIPGASASYRFTENLAAFGNAHKSFRAPQTWSYDFSEKDQDLDFEDGTSYELGLRWDRLSGFSGNVVLWRVEFGDFIDYDPITDVYTNLGEYDSQGIDVTVDLDTHESFGAPEGLRLFATTTIQDSEFANGENKGKDTLYVPSFLANGGVSYHDSTGLYGVFEGHYWGSTRWSTSENSDTPAVRTFDLRLGWRKDIPIGDSTVSIDVAGAVKNLFDHDNYMRRGSDSYVPGAPREFFGTVSLSIDF